MRCCICSIRCAWTGWTPRSQTSCRTHRRSRRLSVLSLPRQPRHQGRGRDATSGCFTGTIASLQFLDQTGTHRRGISSHYSSWKHFKYAFLTIVYPSLLKCPQSRGPWSATPVEEVAKISSVTSQNSHPIDDAMV